MITKQLNILSIVILLLLGSIHLYGQKTKEKNRILFIFDASKSMLGEWQSGKKIDIAKNMLNNMLDTQKDFLGYLS